MINYLNWLKKSDESNKQYQVRLYRNKHTYGLSNDDIGRILNEVNGVEYDESKWRKYTTAYIEGYDDCVESQTVIDDELERLRIAREELYKEKVKNQDAMREYRNMLRKDARRENLYDAVQDSVDKLNKIKPIEIKSYKGKDKSDKIGVLSFSDWHYGDFIDDFTNTFNRDIFEGRIAKLLRQTESICHRENFEKLIVLNLGDLVSGSIHVSTRVNNEIDVITQIQEVSEHIALFLSSLTNVVPKIEFYSVVDNHSRANYSKPDHVEKENFGRFIEWYLKARFQNEPRIKIKSNKIHGFDDYEIGMFDIFDSKAIFSHGHNDKLSSIVPDLTLMIKEFPVAIFTGHLHRNYEDEINEIDLIMSPSLIGTNTYAKSIRKTSKPRQKLVTFKNVNGEAVRGCTYLIDLR